MAEFVRSEILGTTFETTSRYANLQPVGLGTAGIVCSAYDLIAEQAVAIKKMMKPFDSAAIAKRTYREVKLLKQLRHDNLINMSDIFISPLEDVYLVTELLGTDLHRLLSAKPLEGKFVQYFTYQILRGLKYIHSAGVIHRDLKPGNLLINENCDLKICDFGLARLHEPQMTGYVSTRYYRAPEIMLTWQRYGHQVDLWSAGCIVAEMLLGRPLFPGTDHINQFLLIIDLLGNPPDEVVDRITTKNTRRMVTSLGKRNPRPLKEVIPGAEDEAINLLEKLLIFDPDARLTADQSLKHPYMAPYHDPEDEPAAAARFDWSFNDADLPTDEWKIMIYSEVLDFFQPSTNPPVAQEPSQLQPPGSLMGDAGLFPDLATVDPSKFAQMDFVADGQSFDYTGL
ncbi:kinase-like domain-containing protein [Aspergillus undulatus]|uniref:kinase-like domain-containing protein n=1 Tax=Aspergillus undulatus TaxID=1810928 RepID=UPI003CCCF542